MYKFSEINFAWEQVKEYLHREISGVSMDLWFGRLKMIGFAQNTLYMEIDSLPIYNVIMENYYNTILEKFREQLNPDMELEIKCTGHEVTVADIMRNMGQVKIGEDENGKSIYIPTRIDFDEYEDEYEDYADYYDENGLIKNSSEIERIRKENEERRKNDPDFEYGFGSRDRASGSRSRKKSESSSSYGLYGGSPDSKGGYDFSVPFRERDPYASRDPFLKENPTREDLQRSVFEHTYNLNHPRGPQETVEPTVGDDGMPSYNFQYTFENFIVGSSNKFAHAACVAVAEHPAMNYNPLFIYGPSGLGKTHLLNAITNYLRKKNADIKIMYVKGEDFTNYMIDCISRQAMKEFRDRYRKCDVLLIDDIQFIAGKESTQEEFFHTFNALYDDHKQIILTSDRPPRDIERLENRLKSRFEWGLIADIQPPDIELRIAIVKAKSDAVKLHLSPEILQYLAENLRSNVRQIEGAIKKLGAINFLSGKPISMSDAARCVSELLGDDEPVTVTIDKIFTVVFKKYNVTKEDILSAKRNKNIALARHVSIYLVREVTKMSYPSIGTIFGRDHTTVMSSIEAINKKLANDQLFAVEIKELQNQLSS